MHGASGLTLFELLVAVGVAAVLMAGAALGFRDLGQRWQLETGVRQLVLDLRTARISSVSRAAAHRVRFDEDGTSYFRERRNRDRVYVDRRATRLPPGVRLAHCTARGRAISFQPRGNAGTFGTVTLAGPDGSTVDVVVDMVGRVRVRP